MEEVSLGKEEGDSSSDVNVYITIDPASLPKLKKSSSGKRKFDHPHSVPSVVKDCLDELGLKPKWSLCASSRGVLLMFEIVLSLTLLLIAAIASDWHFGYTAHDVGIAMNAVSMAGFIILFMCLLLDVHCFCQESVERFIEITAYLVLLVLQITSFIISMVDSNDPYGPLVTFKILSVIMCCSLLLNVYYTNDEYLKTRKSVLPQTKSKKERVRRRMQKKKKYKRLNQSGF
ncbi:hypothetical protein HOLleu_18848 [Holothuria leucospilota]|uniref:Uncharacterized protein n=1 Tax=Holothuria leucospilota TaxID=206669 RepID=A0A9Q1HA73_HOLLE|nr:hypothetical protein HOLleu_18848 [Holothuria leucospilota]